MKIYKCNACKCVLDPGKDTYYSIGEISYHVPGLNYVRWVNEKDNDDRATHLYKESWVSYTDLDFCLKCFPSVKIKEHIKK